jgi:hypothetical protein
MKQPMRVQMLLSALEEQTRERGGCPSAQNIRDARVAVGKAMDAARRFGELFEMWNRDGEGLTRHGIKESQVIEAMYDMRSAIAVLEG